MLAKFFAWLLLCAIAWTSVLSGYTIGSASMGDDSPTKFTKGHEVAAVGRIAGERSFAYDYSEFDSPENGNHQHTGGSIGDVSDATTYLYDNARDRVAMSSSHVIYSGIYPCCDNDLDLWSSGNMIPSFGSLAPITVNGVSSCDYDETHGLLESKSHAGDFEMTFYSYDGLGSIRGLTDAIGTSLGQYHYDSYGLLIENTVSVANPYQFAGERFDNDLGLYYLRARYLDVETGRFWSLDDFEGSGDPMSLHKYLYANANPVGMIDPSGNFGIMESSAVRSIALNFSFPFAFSLTTGLIGRDENTTVFEVLVHSAIAGAFGVLLGPLAKVVSGVIVQTLIPVLRGAEAAFAAVGLRLFNPIHGISAAISSIRLFIVGASYGTVTAVFAGLDQWYKVYRTGQEFNARNAKVWAGAVLLSIVTGGYGSKFNSAGSVGNTLKANVVDLISNSLQMGIDETSNAIQWGLDQYNIWQTNIDNPHAPHPIR